MKCKVCGAINEDYLEYCENCAAPLKESQAAAGEPTSGGAREHSRSHRRRPPQSLHAWHQA